MKKNGFTLIELVIAIFILAFATVGVYNAFSTMIVLTKGFSNRFTAAYLAQEGLEVIRNMRDSNWINSRDWKTGLDCSSVACEAYYKTGTGILSDFPLEPYSNNGRVLKIDDNGFYNYISGQDTKFKRKIVITPTANLDAIDVSVLVIWDEKGQTCDISSNNCGSCAYCIKAEEYLYNWY